MEEKEKDISRKSMLASWLEKLQQESWQLELLISGFAIFGLFQIYDTIFYDLNNRIAIVSDNSAIFLGILYFIVRIGWLVFTTNLLIHVALRGLWIGAIGLRYISGNIEFDEFKFHENYINRYKKKGDYDDFIERLEKLSSIMFAFTFLVFFSLASFLISFLAFIISVFVIVAIFEDGGGSGININSTAGSIFAAILFFTYVISGIVALFDFFTLGLVKRIKNKYVRFFFAPMLRLQGLISLSFLWYPLYLNFIDDRYAKWFVPFIIPYFVLLYLPSLLIFPQNPLIPDPEKSDDLERHTLIRYEKTIQPEFYEDLREKHNLKSRIRTFCLESLEVSDNMMSVFIAGFNQDYFYTDDNSTDYVPIMKHKARLSMSEPWNDHPTQDSIEQKKEEIIESTRASYPDSVAGVKIDSINKEYRKIQREAYRRFFYGEFEKVQGLFDIRIDGQMLKKEKDLYCYFYTHANADEKGMLCHITLDSMDSGRHIFELTRRYTFSPNSNSRTFQLPFYVVED